MPRKATAKPMVAESEQDAAIEVAKKKGGGKVASIRHNTNATKAEISSVVAGAFKKIKNTRVKDDKECAERVWEYFSECAEQGVIPMWEELALHLGVRRDTIWDWLNGRGCSAERTDLMEKSKEILATVEGRLALGNRANIAAYIFRAKNFFGMKDQQEVVITPNNPLGQEPDQAALEAKIEGIVVDEQ